MSTNTSRNVRIHVTRPRKWLIALLALAAAALPGASPGRMFKGPNAANVDGEPVSVSDSYVIVGTREGRLVKFLRSALSADEQAYVNDWVLNHRKYAFDIRLTPEEVASPKVSTQPKSSTVPVKIAAHNWRYHVTVVNMSEEQTPAMKMPYTVYIQDVTSAGQNVPPRPTGKANADIPSLAPKGGTYQFDTATVALGAFLPSTGYHFTDGNSRYHRIVLAGLEGTLVIADEAVWGYNSMLKNNR